MHSLSTIHKLNRATLPATSRVPVPAIDHCDFLIRDEGTIYLLYTQSAQADSWINQHFSEDATWFGSALVIGHRYVEDILRGIVAEGLGVRR